MLPRTARLHDSADFRRVIRHGVRAGRPTLVVHAAPGSTPGDRVGLVVSKAVGNAVTRNRVKRRLRHLAADELRTVVAAGPAGLASNDYVIRALHPSATAPTRVPADLASAWAQVRTRLTPPVTPVSS